VRSHGRWWLAAIISIVAMFVALSSLSPSVAFAAPEDFPEPEGLKPQITFWKRIFSEISENQAVIHDDRHLDKIYAIIDLPPLPEGGAGEGAIRKARRQKVDREIERTRGVLEKLHRSGGSTSGLDARGREIAALVADLDGKRKYREAGARLRSQTGLKERFRRGLEISQRYLPHMEKVFRGYGLPIELTRLPLVESTFNVKAYSKVGAAGVWQFMPASARIYDLDIDEAVDQRRDPLLATDGAARHLRDDYQMLGKWPLALTAYNHGRGGVAKAVRTVGSDDIAVIVRRYRGKSFGFASRNFYAEFVAALHVEQNKEKYFGKLSDEPLLRYDEVRLDSYIPFTTLAKACGCSTEELQELNLSLLAEVLDGKLHAPAGTTLRLPHGKGREFRAAYAKLGTGERFASQRVYWSQHKVARGQSIGAIARRYGTTTRAIQSANGLKSHRIRAGQILKIPPRGSSSAVAVASVSEKDEPAPSRAKRVASSGKSEKKVAAAKTKSTTTAKRSSFVSHRVKSGQTIGAIARLYGTTIQKIKAHNSLGDLRRIRTGRVLRIPRS
jgi:membrane-bound lytic murein transglycosylase D